jgi:hypothetical protein
MCRLIGFYDGFVGIWWLLGEAVALRGAVALV